MAATCGPTPGCVIADLPLDKPLCEDLATHWPALQRELIDDLNLRYPFFEGASLRQKLLGNGSLSTTIQFWPLTPTGKLKTDAETLARHGCTLSRRR